MSEDEISSLAHATTIFARFLATGAMADRALAADTAGLGRVDLGRVAAEWAHTPGFADRLDMPDRGTAPKVVVVAPSLRG
jgi:hypothetical protein